jgi:hypothetical protein
MRGRGEEATFFGCDSARRPTLEGVVLNESDRQTIIVELSQNRGKYCGQFEKLIVSMKDAGMQG